MDLEDLRSVELTIVAPVSKPWVEQRHEVSGPHKGEPVLVGIQTLSVVGGRLAKGSRMDVVVPLHKNYGEPMPRLTGLPQKRYLLIYRKVRGSEFRLGDDMFGMRGESPHVFRAYPFEIDPYALVATNLEKPRSESDSAAAVIGSLIDSVDCPSPVSASDALHVLAAIQPIPRDLATENGAWYLRSIGVGSANIMGQPVIEWYKRHVWPELTHFADTQLMRRAEILDILVKWGDDEARALQHSSPSKHEPPP